MREGIHCESRCEPCTVGRCETAELACDDARHHRVTSADRTLHLDRVRDCPDNFLTVEKNRALLSKGDNDRPNPILFADRARLSENGFRCFQVPACEFLELKQIRLDNSRPRQERLAKTLATG